MLRRPPADGMLNGLGAIEDGHRAQLPPSSRNAAAASSAAISRGRGAPGWRVARRPGRHRVPPAPQSRTRPHLDRPQFQYRLPRPGPARAPGRRRGHGRWDRRSRAHAPSPSGCPASAGSSPAGQACSLLSRPKRPTPNSPSRAVPQLRQWSREMVSSPSQTGQVEMTSRAMLSGVPSRGRPGGCRRPGRRGCRGSVTRHGPESHERGPRRPGWRSAVDSPTWQPLLGISSSKWLFRRSVHCSLVLLVCQPLFRN